MASGWKDRGNVRELSGAHHLEKPSTLAGGQLSAEGVQCVAIDMFRDAKERAYSPTLVRMKHVLTDSC